jgi:ribosome biogenesis GTPase
MTGTIIKALSKFYYVEYENATYECVARGNFRKSGVSPLVGDSVEFEATGQNTGVVNKILPRKNFINRPPVANIDKLFIVSSFTSPPPNTAIIDKMTVMAEYNHIEPIIVFNKCDMGDFSKWVEIYRNSGFKVYTVSAMLNQGIEELRLELKDFISAFTGNSGVGKSSILNSLLGENLIATGQISEKLGRGRHTTRHTELYKLNFGGFVADTPGFSSLELDTMDYSLKENLQYAFPDFGPYLGKCQFHDCAHLKEPGCAVTAALKAGEIEPTRYDSYAKLYEKAKEIKLWELK